MKFKVRIFICIIFFLSFVRTYSQLYITKDIKSFGAKGNGNNNDQAAFKKASDFFNARGGNGKLIISKGTYIIGKQTFTGGKANKPAYETEDVLHFSNVKNMSVQGTPNSILKYQDGLRYGTFDPQTGNLYEHGDNYFLNSSYAVGLGYCVFFENSSNISVSQLTLDGNSNNLILGGTYGDVGRQLTHYGIFIKNSFKIIIDKMYAHHFALDGISIANDKSIPQNEIRLTNSAFEYNARQGLSWVGGNGLYVKNCKFNHTGKGKFESPPGAGLDIEAENGPIRNGVFENCEFIDNAGVSMGADSGDGADCIFKRCTFWGITNWSIWVTKPGFTFISCNVYGCFVHGYDSPNEKDATKFVNCNFEDKTYNGKEAFGTYLIESNGKKRLTFYGCNFIANKKKLCWIQTTSLLPEERYKFTNCKFIIKNANYPEADFVAVIRGMIMKNCTFEFKSKEAKRKRYWLNDYDKDVNTDLGGNKIIYAE